jgi:hypothetical protein
MDIGALLGNVSEDSIERQVVLKEAKKLLPHIVYDAVPFEFDTEGNVKNQNAAISLSAWQREIIYDLKPKEKPLIVSNLVNGSGKTYLLGLCLTLLLIDDHPALSPGLMGVKGDIWLLTNSSLLKTEYPANFTSSPGWLGQKSAYENGTFDSEGNEICPKGHNDIINSRGEKHRIQWVKDEKGIISGFNNLTNGKRLRFWSYSVNEQKLAGHNPITIFCDEFGDKTTTNSATGANRLTADKMAEMLVRVGRNHVCGNNWVFGMFFTLTLGEEWVEKMLDLMKEGRWFMPELAMVRNMPADTNFVHFVRSRSTVESNPSINKSTVAFALDFFRNLDMGQVMERRLISTDLDDPDLVFPKSCRPLKLDPDKAKEIIELSRKEPGWQLVECVDPGWADQCAVEFALVHPIKGIYILDEFYASGKTVPQVATVVKHIEQSTFPGIKVAHRFYDPYHIRKTTQESPVPNYYRWRDAGLPGHAAKHSRDRSYDQIFELFLNGLVHYFPIKCSGLDKELRNHKKDKYGIPEEKKNNHAIDCIRHICNWYHFEFAKKIHLTYEITKEMTPEQKIYQAQLNYYNNYVKHKFENKSNDSPKVFGVSIKPLNTNNIKRY